MIRRAVLFNQASRLRAMQTGTGQADAAKPRLRHNCGVRVVKESEMVRRIILGLLLVGFTILIYVGYKNWSARRSMLAGDVISGPSEPLPPGSMPLPSTPPTQGRPTAATTPDLPSTAAETGRVVTDSQAPDAPNGARFGGTGRYEVYRQGNLTYRIDTGNGQSCVLYATKEEWLKPEVYRHGCGNSAAQ